MSKPPPNKLDHAPLAPVLARLELDEALILPEGARPSDAVASLVASGHLDEAVAVLAYCLPKREAVWWGCMCAAGPAAGPAQAAMEAAQAWVRRPSEQAGRAAWAAAEACRFRGPEAWAAVAAFWSGPSLNDAGQQAVAPPVHLTGTAVLASVKLALARVPSDAQPAAQRRFLQAGQDIALGGTGRLTAAS